MRNSGKIRNFSGSIQYVTISFVNEKGIPCNARRGSRTPSIKTMETTISLGIVLFYCDSSRTFFLLIRVEGE